jgi:hypothetical protein
VERVLPDTMRRACASGFSGTGPCTHRPSWARKSRALGSVWGPRWRTAPPTHYTPAVVLCQDSATLGVQPMGGPWGAPGPNLSSCRTGLLRASRPPGHPAMSGGWCCMLWRGSRTHLLRMRSSPGRTASPAGAASSGNTAEPQAAFCYRGQSTSSCSSGVNCTFGIFARSNASFTSSTTNFHPTFPAGMKRSEPSHDAGSKNIPFHAGKTPAGRMRDTWILRALSMLPHRPVKARPRYPLG